MTEELKMEMRAQTELLKMINDNITGLRADVKAASAKGVTDSMAQVLGAVKGTPMEGLLANMMAKAGQPNG